MKDLKKLIEGCGLNQAMLARKIGITKGTFCKKISPDYPNEFTVQEINKLYDELNSIVNSIIKAKSKLWD